MQGQRGVFVIATTNKPWDIDTGFFRRFSNHIYIHLPNLEDRKKIWEKHFEGIENLLLQRDFWYLAKETENFSGSDIDGVVLEAKHGALRRALKAKYFKKVGHYYHPCTKNDKHAMKIDSDEVPDDWITGPPIDMRDVEVAFNFVKSKYDPSDEEKYKEHQKTYGH